MASPVKLKAELEKITPFAEDVFRLDFKVERKYTRFKPGQFLHLTLEDFDPTQAYWPESRVFSICSPPKSQTLSMIYSVKGAYTSRMREELKEGEEYWLKLPYGDFIIEQLLGPEAPAVLVAGGTGISPFVSYLEEGLEKGFRRSVYLGYAVRSPERLAFTDLLRRAGGSDAVTQRVWSEQDGESGREPAESAPGKGEAELITDTGALDLKAILQDVAAWDAPHFFLSGPPGMLTAFSDRLTSAGVSADRVHIDEWE